MLVFNYSCAMVFPAFTSIWQLISPVPAVWGFHLWKQFTAQRLSPVVEADSCKALTCGSSWQWWGSSAVAADSCEALTYGSRDSFEVLTVVAADCCDVFTCSISSQLWGSQCSGSWQLRGSHLWQLLTAVKPSPVVAADSWTMKGLGSHSLAKASTAYSAKDMQMIASWKRYRA